VFADLELAIDSGVQWLRLAVETMGALVIALGAVIAMVMFVVAVFARRPDQYNGVRLTLARYLAVALEFQLAGDILSTAIAPSWDQIGKLAAIAVIRTALNFFLTKEMNTAVARAAVGTGSAPSTVR
jgi:uncharacterized membrane protein